MGSEFSKCCSGSGNGGEQELLPQESKAREPSPSQLKEYERSLKKGVDVRITLGDYSRLSCELHYSAEIETFYISCNMQGERRVRPVPMSSIAFLLRTEAEIATLEDAAGVHNDDHCVGLCLEEEGGCLPLFFKTEQEKRLFVGFVTQRMRCRPS